MARSNPTLSELKVRMAVMSLPSTIDQGTRRMRGLCPKVVCLLCRSGCHGSLAGMYTIPQRP